MNIATLSIRASENENARSPSSDSSPAPEGDAEEDTDDLASLTLRKHERLTLENEYRFFGKSSGMMLIQTALDIKKEYAKAAGAPELIERSPSPSSSPDSP